MMFLCKLRPKQPSSIATPLRRDLAWFPHCRRQPCERATEGVGRAARDAGHPAGRHQEERAVGAAGLILAARPMGNPYGRQWTLVRLSVR
eukprot:6206147-Pleurochrysis_carterae.AAC.1